MLRLGIRFPFGMELKDTLRGFVQYDVNMLFNTLIEKYKCIPEYEDQYIRVYTCSDKVNIISELERIEKVLMNMHGKDVSVWKNLNVNWGFMKFTINRSIPACEISYMKINKLLSISEDNARKLIEIVVNEVSKKVPIYSVEKFESGWFGLQRFLVDVVLCVKLRQYIDSIYIRVYDDRVEVHTCGFEGNFTKIFDLIKTIANRYNLDLVYDVYSNEITEFWLVKTFYELYEDNVNDLVETTVNMYNAVLEIEDICIKYFGYLP